MEKKEAIKILKDFHDESALFSVRTALETLYPELKESEDEKVRKEIVEYLKKNLRLEWATWLEKQGEQKPADKVEPKFKVGDWVVYYRNDSSREVLQVYDIRDGRYYFTDNVHFSWSVKECDEKSHLWTIQDAKDGDVLAFKNNIGGIIICKSPTDYDTRSYCRLVSDNLINKEESGWDSTLFVPATKEQRDLLFQKMKEAGYEWDADKKELKLLITNGGDFFESENCEQKPTWSEEDEKMLADACIMLDWYQGNNWWTARHIKDWLKSLKERIGG